ncbi:MAG: hypothetical protein NVS3B20_00460 [Polyangiales bacterium]
MLKSPRLIAVTFPAEPLAADIELLLSTLATSAHWKAATTDYGIGMPTTATPIHLTEPSPASIDDAAIQSWLASRLDGTHAEWGTPTDQSVYVILYPQKTTIKNFSTQSCVGWTGYHGSTKLNDGTVVAYAVVAQCDPARYGLDSMRDFVSITAVHESLEAATDPQPDTNPAFAAVNAEDGSWNFFPGSEVVDLCKFNPNSTYRLTEGTFLVQRYWLNSLAAAGHDPCFPHLSKGAYFNSAPVLNDKVKLTYGGFPMLTRGVHIAVGESAVVELALFSDGKPEGPWSVSAMDREQRYGRPPTLSFAFDQASGSNGDRLHMTIKVLRADPNYGAEPFMITSTLGDQRNVWFGLVGR